MRSAMQKLQQSLTQFFGDESGATAIEYGLISALIAVGAIIAFTFFGNNLVSLFDHVKDRTGNAMGGG